MVLVGGVGFVSSSNHFLRSEISNVNCGLLSSDWRVCSLFLLLGESVSANK